MYSYSHAHLHTRIRYYFALSSGAPIITGQIEFSLMSALTDPPVFTLTCVSAGGPAMTVTWTQDGVAATGVTSQTVTSLMTATYTNTLTVTGRLPGVYKCRVQNDRGFDAEARTVIGKGCNMKTLFSDHI